MFRFLSRDFERVLANVYVGQLAELLSEGESSAFTIAETARRARLDWPALSLDNERRPGAAEAKALREAITEVETAARSNAEDLPRAATAFMVALDRVERLAGRHRLGN